MKEKTKKIIAAVLALALIAGGGWLLSNKLFSLQDTEVINISNLPEEFLDEYFESYNEIPEEQKENILIVTSLAQLHDKHGASKVIPAPNHQYILQYESAEARDVALVAFEQDQTIESVDRNAVLELFDAPYNSWGIEKMALDSAINLVKTDTDAPEVKVAVIDTGCDVGLVNKYYPGKITESYNALNNDTAISGMLDTNGHGTHIAGTVAEGTPPNVKVVPVKASSGKTLFISDIIKGINYVVSNHQADVINLSLGGYDYVQSLYNAIAGANAAGIVTVAAAGNEDTSAWSYPAAFDNTISIASVDSELQRSSFSNYGETIDFAAPGSAIKSTMADYMSMSSGADNDSDFETINGTSMAAPHAANAVAILKSFNKEITKDDVMTLLRGYATIDLGVAGKDVYYGYGFIKFNPESFCDRTNPTACEEHGIFKSAYRTEVSGIAISEGRHTERNYGTINNLSPTEVQLQRGDGTTETVLLGQLVDARITGYDPYAAGEQIIQVEWQGMQSTFSFSNPESWESGWEYTVAADDSATITGFTDFNTNDANIKEFYLPATIDGHTVTEIAGTKIFGGAQIASYEKIILPNTLTKISGDETFAGFTALRKVNSQAERLDIIGSKVFSDDEKLSEVTTILNLVGVGTFYNDSSLLSARLWENMETLPEQSFSACIALANITLPQHLQEIGTLALANTLSLTSLELPETLERLGDGALLNSRITSLQIPQNVNSIGTQAIAYNEDLEHLSVAENNITYDSRENSNAIIETASNKLIHGSNHTTIPASVREIDSMSFVGAKIAELPIPEGVTTIAESAFYRSLIDKISIPESVQTIAGITADTLSTVQGSVDLTTFYRYDGQFVTLYGKSTSFAVTYAQARGVPYEATNISTLTINRENLNFQAFEQVESDVTVYYDYAEWSTAGYGVYLGEAGRSETIAAKDLEIIYSENRDSFRFGDTSFKVRGTTQRGENFEVEVTGVVVSKLTPTYETPTGLTARVKQTLAEITLPGGFAWMNPDQVIEEAGQQTFKAKYTPTDTTNYTEVTDIDVTITVSSAKTVITPAISISSKTYDGTTSLSPESITVTNLDSSDYTLISATTEDVNAGAATAAVMLKLSDAKFADYAFQNQQQEQTFTVKFSITKANLSVVDHTEDLSVRQDGQPHTLPLNLERPDGSTVKYADASGNYMLDQAPSYREPGTYLIKYKVSLNNNYTEYFGEHTLQIREAKQIVNKSRDYEGVYDGAEHTIKLDIGPEGYTIKYSTTPGAYDLTELPRFRDPGEYTVYYKISIEDGDDVEGSNLVKIYGIKQIDNSLHIDNTALGNNVAALITEDSGFEALRNKIEVYSPSSAVSYEHYNKNHEPVDTDALGTGDIVKVLINGTALAEYRIVYRGDTNGDGKISYLDYVSTYNHIRKLRHPDSDKSLLSDEYLLAADITGDGKISFLDYVRIYNKVKETRG